jgi:hypothetical protein
LVGRTERKKSLGRLRHRWEDIIKWILKAQTGMVWVGFIRLKVGTIVGLSEQCNKPLNPMNGRKFLEEYFKFSRALLIGVH